MRLQPAAPSARSSYGPILRSLRARLPSAGHLFRIAIGLAFVGVGALFLHDRFLATEVRQAVLTGAAVTLRAPIEGVLEMPIGTESGQLLNAGSVLAVVRNPRADTARLADLARQRRLAEAELATLARRHAEAVAAQDAAGRRAEAFVVARNEMLAARLQETDSVEAAAAQRAQETAAALRRAGTLAASGVQAQATLDTARRAAAAAEADLRAAADRRRSMAAERNAALAGVLASDPANDRSASAQAEERMRLLAGDLAAQADEARARLAALISQEEAETARLALLREAVVTVPMQARLIRRLAQPGEQIRPGQDLALLADCAQPEVTGSAEPRVFARLAPGYPVRFRAEGESHWREGNVVTLHAEPPAADGSGGRFQVVARLAPRVDGMGTCEAGRLGRLVFD
jgi:biotin carboxyl carrier protein